MTTIQKLISRYAPQFSWEKVSPETRLRLLRGALALFCALLLNLLPLDFFESYLYDLRIRMRPSPAISAMIETIVIDPQTIETNKGQPTFGNHLEFLKKLKEDGPRAIVYLLNPKDFSGTASDQKAFADFASQLPGFYVVTDETALRGEIGKFDLPGPLKAVPVLSGPITSDSKNFAQDGVTRRMLITYQDNLLFHPYLASQIIPSRGKSETLRGAFNFYDSTQVYIDFVPPNSFPKLRFQDVLAGAFPKGRYSQKVVFVGSELGQSSKEYVRTPYSRRVTGMTAVETHANMLNALLLNSAPKQLPGWLEFLLLACLVVLAVEVVLTMKPVRGIIVLGLTVLVFSTMAFIAFWPFGFWVHLAQPLLGVFMAYYLLIPYRLIVENRRSWELYQKNKILTQVEELKTNFMGMMSHDLKTPLARIQGMLEIVQRDKNPLSEDQKSALKSIQQSTEDLLKFISSILNFSRLEAEGVQLKLKSKDLNSIVEEVIQKTDYLAQEKNIKIVKQLEPLFSMKLDPDLFRQVISNLLENAIKYSPEKSKVIIKTEEKNNKVYLHVVDEGIGIPEDELPRLFMKFFRSRRAKNSTVKGSGLGLFLARYFVELHHGKLTASSIENKGSTFTIELPLGS